MNSELGELDQRNIDSRTIDGFGAEWSRFDQSELPEREASELFAAYFSLVDLSILGPKSVAMDVGCGSGRWARLLVHHVGRLILVDPAVEALEVARRNLAGLPSCAFFVSDVDSLPCEDDSIDLVYSIGVLHHVPDTPRAIKACVKKVKPGGHLLLYLYYRFDNRPRWFRLVWAMSDVLRRFIFRLPEVAKRLVADVLAVVVYLPLASLARWAESRGCNVDAWPLSSYRDRLCTR